MIKYLIYSGLISIVFFAACRQIKDNPSKNNLNKVAASNIIRNNTDIDVNYSLFNFIDSAAIDRFENEILKFEISDNDSFPPKNAILFVGSSTIRLWDSVGYDMLPFKAFERGFGGSTIWEVNYYAPRIIFPYQPAAIVFYAGENDLSWAAVSSAAALHQFKNFVKTIDYWKLNTPIFFISIKSSPSRAQFQQKFDEANLYIQRFAERRQNVHFIDIRNSMLDSTQTLRRDIFLNDKLHMNRKGYMLWREVIKKILEEELQSLNLQNN